MEEKLEQVIIQDTESIQRELEDKMVMAAEHIRNNSAAIKLTKVTDLLEEPIGINEEELNDIVNQLMDNENNADLETVSGSSEKYLFSTCSISKSYAVIMTRIEDNNLMALIAGTVRDESKIYPRPTTILTFMEPPFNLTKEELIGAIAQMRSHSDFKDIQKINVSNGAIYLSSSKYLEKSYAQSLAEDIEVPPSE
ncbi:MAG: hypothetical protein SCK28_06945 [Bacillota bacterium]|nr:hypothetical protein [Bacillota bacterium]